jgi:uncharacterized protein YukE
MIKLSKTESKSREEVTEAVREAYKAVEAIWPEYQAMLDKVNGVIDAFNSAVADADNFRQSVADQMQEYYDNRSDAWQNGDKGTAYREWLEQWLYSVEQVDEVEAQEMPVINGLDELEQAASELEF